MPEKAEKVYLISTDDSVFRFLSVLFKDTKYTLIRATEGNSYADEIKRIKPMMAIIDMDRSPAARLIDLCGILSECPLPVFLLTREAEKAHRSTVKGIRIGAVDVLEISSGAPKIAPEERDRLMGVIQTGATIEVKQISYSDAILIAGAQGEPAEIIKPEINASQTLDTNYLKRGFDAVGVAISTGGPNALSHLIPSLPAEFPVPMLVVQHIIPGFIDEIVTRLDRNCSLRVKIAEQGEPLAAGAVYFAPDKKHLMVKNIGGRLYTHLSPEPSNLLFCPSADVLFKSMAEACGPRCMAVIMTGMGHDGVDGLRFVKSAGGSTIAQDRRSSVIYGMARVAVDAKLIDRVVPLDNIAGEVYKLIANEVPDHSVNERVSS